MAETLHHSRRGAGQGSPGPELTFTPQQRPASAAPRMGGASRGASPAIGAAQPRGATPQSQPTARRILDFLQREEDAAAGGRPPSMFPSSAEPSGAPGTDNRGGQAAPSGRGATADLRPRPRSAVPLRATGGPRVREEALDVPVPEPPARRYGRVSLFDRGGPHGDDPQLFTGGLETPARATFQAGRAYGSRVRNLA